jgi:hypothetical protein
MICSWYLVLFLALFSKSDEPLESSFRPPPLLELDLDLDLELEKFEFELSDLSDEDADLDRLLLPRLLLLLLLLLSLLSRDRLLLLLLLSRSLDLLDPLRLLLRDLLLDLLPPDLPRRPSALCPLPPESLDCLPSFFLCRSLSSAFSFHTCTCFLSCNNSL